MESLLLLFDQSRFMPHGMCFLWMPSLLWLHVGSDALIALAYVSIPVTLWRFVRLRRDLPFHGVFLLFALFIVACGATHALAIWDVWQADYWVSGSVKAITAVASVGTAIALIRLMPAALELPSPAMLRTKNNELEREILEHRKTQHELKQALAEKSTLLQEVHHRVKNNLQIISSLMRIQSRFVEDRLSIDTLRESENRIRSMALLHEKLYQTDTFGSVDLKDYANGLIGDVCDSFGEVAARVAVETDVAKIRLATDLAVPFGLIVCELVSNSLKHAFTGQGAGTISVRIGRSGNSIELVVADSGPGLPASIDPLRADTMGLQLIASLAGQLGADYEPATAGSSRFRLRFDADNESGS